MSLVLIIRPEAEMEMIDAFGWYEKSVKGLGSEFILAADLIRHVINGE